MPINYAAATILVITVLFALIAISRPGVPTLTEGGNRGAAASTVTILQPSVGVITHAVAAPAATRRDRTGSGGLWAEVDPVPDIRSGRAGNVTVNGTTNAPAGISLRIDFIAHSMHPSPMEYDPDLWFGKTVPVTKGDGGVNTWSAEICPQDFKKPDEWQILVTDTRSSVSIGSGIVNVTA